MSLRWSFAKLFVHVLQRFRAYGAGCAATSFKIGNPSLFLIPLPIIPLPFSGWARECLAEE
jgi:hypothetical protein